MQINSVLYRLFVLSRSDVPDRKEIRIVNITDAGGGIYRDIVDITGTGVRVIDGGDFALITGVGGVWRINLRDDGMLRSTPFFESPNQERGIELVTVHGAILVVLYDNGSLIEYALYQRDLLSERRIENATTLYAVKQSVLVGNRTHFFLWDKFPESEVSLDLFPQGGRFFF
jgi:hypothetical protein